MEGGTISRAQRRGGGRVEGPLKVDAGDGGDEGRCARRSALRAVGEEHRQRLAVGDGVPHSRGVHLRHEQLKWCTADDDCRADGERALAEGHEAEAKSVEGLAEGSASVHKNRLGRDVLAAGAPLQPLVRLRHLLLHGERHDGQRVGRAESAPPLRLAVAADCVGADVHAVVAVHCEHLLEVKGLALAGGVRRGRNRHENTLRAVDEARHQQAADRWVDGDELQAVGLGDESLVLGDSADVGLRCGFLRVVERWRVDLERVHHLGNRLWGSVGGRRLGSVRRGGGCWNDRPPLL